MRRLSAGLLLSRTGDQLTTIALVWFVLDLTGSGVAVGLVLLCAGLPPVVTGPLLGRLLDRWPPGRVMVADNLARAALVGVVPVLHWLDRLNMPLLYGLSLAGALLGLATVPVVARLRPGLALAGNPLAWGAALLPCSSSPRPSRRCSCSPLAGWSGRPTPGWRPPCSSAWSRPAPSARCSGSAGP